jgi:hypothetical protein
MKFIIATLLIVITLFSFVPTRNNILIDVEKSKVVWTRKKFTGDHSGTVMLKSKNLNVINNKLTGGSFEIVMTTIINTDIKDNKCRNKLVEHLKSSRWIFLASINIQLLYSKFAELK